MSAMFPGAGSRVSNKTHDAGRAALGAPSLRILQEWDSTDAAYRDFSAATWAMERPTLSHRTRKDGTPSGLETKGGPPAKTFAIIPFAIIRESRG
jgi:hypothetical protein